MPGFDHGAVPPPENEPEPRAARQTLYGRVLFVFYLVLYGGFVFLNAFSPTTMEETPLAGVNLAVVYGLGLIAVAFLLAVLYDWLCRIPSGGQER